MYDRGVPYGGLWSFHEPVRTASRDWRPHALKINHCEVDTTRVETPRRSAQALTQRKEYDSVINERDILGAQLIRRNDEIGLLQEKLKIQHSTLTRGEEQYSARVHDVQVLRLKIRDMQREVAVASGGAQLSDDLRRDLLQCRRDLLEEKAKCKALTQRMLKLVQLDSSRRWRLRASSCPPRHRRGAMLASRQVS